MRGTGTAGVLRSLIAVLALSVGGFIIGSSDQASAQAGYGVAARDLTDSFLLNSYYTLQSDYGSQTGNNGYYAYYYAFYADLFIDYAFQYNYQPYFYYAYSYNYYGQFYAYQAFAEKGTLLSYYSYLYAYYASTYSNYAFLYG